MTIRRTTRTALAAAVCTGLVALGASACGTVKELTAAQKVSGAFGKLGEGKSVKAVLSLNATADQLVAFDKASSSEDKIDAKTAAAIAGTTLSVAVTSDKPLKEAESAAKAQGQSGDATFGAKGMSLEYLLASKDGKAYLDVRSIDGKPYLKLDAEGLLALTGQDSAELKSFLDEVPAELKIVKDALGDKWVSLDPKLLTELSKGMPGAAGKPSAAPSMDPKAAESLVQSLKDTFTRSVSFEDRGTKDGVDHIVAIADAKALADGFANAAKPLAGKLPGFKDLPTGAPSDLTNNKVDIDLFLKDGTLTSLSFDLAQLDDKAGKDVHVPVKLALSQDAGQIQAPAGATEFGMSDLTNLMGMFTKGMADGLGAKPGALPGSGAGAGAGKAAPLTADQLKELEKLGVSEDQLKLLNASGMSYEDIKALADMKGQS
ncbi:hypothetical protein ABT095_03170 [Kitasatospora sp. NPDC002227]|uniref:hypothetical protein n=1 Tax=Kitasatospora sp. NPDC002227 TaxID=3154773 RepID=UPI0033293524